MNWYKIEKINDHLYHVHEPDHVSFYFYLSGREALFIDTGLGLCKENFETEILKKYDIESFDILATHAHCDHAGMNSLARNIFISKLEWKKYLAQNEITQIEHYYKLLQSELTWPPQLSKTPLQHPWRPTHFIKDGQYIEWGKYKFHATHLPGHTIGSMVFLEEHESKLFLGDFIYNGMLYLHLEDSCLNDFKNSVIKLRKLVNKTGPQFLPCHNDIPLKHEYLTNLELFLTDYVANKIPPSGEWPASAIFKEALIFEKHGIRIAIKRS